VRILQPTKGEEKIVMADAESLALLNRILAELQDIKGLVRSPQDTGCLVCGEPIQRPWNCHRNCAARERAKGVEILMANVPD
jgi:hypothetical protein